MAADGYITVVHKVTGMVETVPESYYEELKEVFRPITKKEQTALDKSRTDPDADSPVEEVPTAQVVANDFAAADEAEAQEGAK